MIAKTKIGRSFKGICNYLNSKVIAGQGKVLETQGVREENKLMISDFNRSRQFNDRLTRCVWHTSLRFTKEDKLTDETMIKISKDWMSEMGLLNTQYAIIKHTDTDPHIHILASRIDNNNGKTISDSNNWPRSEMKCRMLEEKYKLERLPDVRQETKINQEALKGRDKFKSECHIALQDALRNSKNIDDFNQYMNSRKIECLWKFNPDGSPRGLSFKKDEVKIKASDINRIYAAKCIAKYIEHNQYQAERKITRQTKSAAYHTKEAAYQFSSTIKNHGSSDDDIIRIDKVINPLTNTKKSLGYGR